MAKFSGGTTPIDLQDFDAELQDLGTGTSVPIHTATQDRRTLATDDFNDFFGSKFLYDGSNNLISGTITRIASVEGGATLFDLSGLSLTDKALDNFIAAGDGQAFLTAVFAGNDSISGSIGNDTLQGFAGNDSFNGGKGDDVYWVDDAKDVVTESLTFAAGGGTDLVHSKGTFTLGTNVDNLALIDGAKADGTGNAIDNVLTGNDHDNKLTGLAGNDNLVGNAGNDTLDGGTGNDTMTGGEGDDLYIADTAADIANISETGASLGDKLQTSLQLSNVIPGIEHYVFTGTKAVNFLGDAAANSITGTAAADTIDGAGGNNTLAGLAGNDQLTSGSGDDSIDGGAGMDTMTGGDGNDTYVVDNAKDIVTEGLNAGTDEIRSTVTFSIAALANIENLTLLGTGAINATGDAGANKLTGNSGANKLDDGGVGGNDTMDGGKGNDTYVVNNAGDQVSEDTLNGGGTDTVLSSVSFTLTGNIENLTLAAGPANIDATGNASANTLTGNDGANELDGGGGIDKLIGGKGDDTYVVYDSKTTVTESATLATGGGTDLVKSSATFTLGTNVDNLLLLEI